MKIKTPTVWIEPSDHDLRARQALVLLAQGKDVGESNVEVLRRIAELASEPSVVTLGLRVRFVRREKRDVEYSVEEMLAATRALDDVIEVRPPPEPDPSPPHGLFATDGKCPHCGEPQASETAYVRHDIEKHDGMRRIRELHQELYCPRLPRCGCKIGVYEAMSWKMASERLGLDWDPNDPFGVEKQEVAPPKVVPRDLFTGKPMIDPDGKPYGRDMRND